MRAEIVWTAAAARRSASSRQKRALESRARMRARRKWGWKLKVRRVIAHYEQQGEEDALIEDEAGVESSETVMSVPRELVPKVRELIAKQSR